MSFKLILMIVLMCGIAVSAKDICDSSSNYRLFESSKKCYTLGNNLALTTLGLIAAAGLSTIVSRDMPLFFLAISPIPLLAAMPFYITGGIQRGMYNSHRTKCGNFKRTDLSMLSGAPDDDLPFDPSPASSSTISYGISLGFDF